MRRMNFYLFKTAELGIIIVICVHWAACLEYYLPLVVAKIFGPDDKSVNDMKTLNCSNCFYNNSK